MHAVPASQVLYLCPVADALRGYEVLRASALERLALPKA